MDVIISLQHNNVALWGQVRSLTCMVIITHTEKGLIGCHAMDCHAIAAYLYSPEATRSRNDGVHPHPAPESNPSDSGKVRLHKPQAIIHTHSTIGHTENYSNNNVFNMVH